MDHIEIDMVEPQLPQTGVEGAVERIRRKLIMPDLRGDEELVPVHAGRRDGRADSGFVVVHRGGVDMSIAERERTLDDRLGVGSWHPEGAEAEAGNRDTLCRDRLHDVFLSRVSGQCVGAFVPPSGGKPSQGQRHQVDAWAWLALTSSAMTLSSVAAPFTADRPCSLNSIHPSLKPSSIRIRGDGFRVPWARKICSQLSRGTVSTRTVRFSTVAKARARSFGDMRAGPSNSTTRVPLPSFRRSAAARSPTSCVATIGNGLSAGCRKLRSTPSSRAEGTSQSAFSMNQPGLRKVTDRPICSSDCSSNVRWVSRFSCGASAPMVDRQTTLPGRASAKARVTAAMTRLASGKPGSGSNSEGGRIKTPAAPLKAEVRLAASSISARAMSQPRVLHSAALASSRRTARTGSFSVSRLRATAPPTLPVIPVIAYMMILQEVDVDRAGSGESGIEAALELAVERDDPRIEEWQDLSEERAGDMLHRVEPEVAVEQARPGDAAGGTPVRSRLHVDVERQAPFMRLPRELVEAARIWRLCRVHLLDVQFADLVLHHHGDRLRTQDSDTMQRAAVQQRLQERDVVPRRTEGAAAAHEELRPLRHLEGCRLQPAIGAAVVEGGDAPLLLGPDQKPRILHTERREDVLAEVDLKRLVRHRLNQLADPIHADAVLPPLARLELERSPEGGVLAGRDVGHTRHLLVAGQSLAPDRVGVAGGMRQQMAHPDRTPGRPHSRRSILGKALEDLRRGQFGQVFCRVVVQVQAALLNQLHAGRRSEGLGHRQQPEHGVERHRSA